MGLLRLGGSNPPLSARFDKPPYGGFFVTGIHERRRRAPVIGIHGKVFSHVAACRSAAPALYPTPGIGPQPCTPASCICPRSEEHTPELQSLMRISHDVFCLKTKYKLTTHKHT